MKPLRVLTVGHSYVVATNRAVVDKVARHPGIELTVVAPRFFQGDLRPIPFEATGATPYRLVTLPAHLTRVVHIFFYRGLRRLATPGAFDLVHAWEEPYIYAGYQIARAAAAGRARYSFWTAQNLSKRYPPPFDRFERYCVGVADGWLACGYLVQQTMLARGYSDRLSEVITLAVDEDKFSPDPAAGAAVRRRLGLVGPVIGYLGRLTAVKGMDVLMAALERVPGPWNLLIVGGGPYEDTLRRWAGERGWSDRLRIVLAKHDEVPDYLRAMDLLVAPSQTAPDWKEQFGRMVVEAFACGIPVIGSDSAEIPYVIADAGLVVPEADSARWAEAIAGLLESPARRRQLAEAGSQRCQELYTSTRVAERYVAYYRKVMDLPRDGGRDRTAPGS